MSNSRTLPIGRRIGAATVAVAMLAVTIGVLAATTAPAAAAAPPVVDSHPVDQVTADALPTVQIDGVVWDQAVVGNTVYVVGDFDRARPAGSPPGVNEVVRSNMLAYDLTTGQLRNDFVANLNSQAFSVVPSPDGSRIYVGGQFTNVNGVNRYRIAALDPVTGNVIAGFNAVAGYNVNDLVVTETTVYAGGNFGYAGPNAATPRSYLAAFTVANGSLTNWAPSADGRVQTLLLSPDGSKLIIGGQFRNVNGQYAWGQTALSLVDGSVLSWPVNQIVKVGGDLGSQAGAILDFKTDGQYVYGGGFTFGRDSGNLEGAFKVDGNTGELVWIEDCHGDTYQVLPVQGLVYKAAHVHYCGNSGGYPQTDNRYTQWGEYMRFSLAFTQEATGTLRRDNWSYWSHEGRPSPSLTHWYPDWQIGSFTGQNQATWAVTGNDDYVVYGGEFVRVNNQAQQGLVRFARRPLAPRDEGPRLGAAQFPVKVVSEASGQVRVTFPANYDRDNSALTYRITRDGSTVHTTTASSSFYDRPTVNFVDTGLVPGATHTYRVVVNDPDGNQAISDNVPVVVADTGAPSAYANQVLADGARIHWRLGDPVGASTAEDAAGFNTGATNAITFGRPGAIAGDADTAMTPTGTSSRIVQPSFINSQGLEERNPTEDDISVETWFRTTSNSGGRLIGFGDSQTGNSSSNGHDRMLYVANNGRVLWGVRTAAPGTVEPTSSRLRMTVQSPAGLNDGQWHHVVGTLSSTGMRLYVDGVEVGSRSDLTGGHQYYGFWKVGADTINSGWSSAPSSTRLNGDIDEAAVYHDELTSAQIANHNSIGRNGPANAAPTASFTATPTDLTVAFDGSASSDPEGPVASYAWDFGDGTTGTGPTPGHTYAAAGTYTVKLIVTDAGGLTATTTQLVTVTENLAPSASFTATPTDLAVAFDGSASSDPEGPIVSYAWDFGDGTTGDGVVPGHTYAAEGTYTVTLTVTDGAGLTGTATQTVTVTAAPPIDVAPTASFTATPTNLAVEFDATASSDPEGPIVSYAWDFGDGTSGTGINPNHPYATGGTYTVTLTVTDGGAQTATATQTVTATEPPPAGIAAADSFTRTVSNGLGTADVGGTWSVVGSAANYSVADGAGRHHVTAPGARTESALTGVSAGDAIGTIDVSFDQVPAGGGTYTYFGLRRNGTSDYQMRVRFEPTGASITLYRVVNGSYTTLTAVGIPLTYQAGDVVRLEFQTIGSGTTTLSAKAWKTTDAEPANWQATAEDSTAALQNPGGVTFANFASGTNTNTPLTVSLDNLSVTGPTGGGPANVAPTAAFTASPTDLTATFDASASTDPEGPIASYTWNFGDSTTGTGVNPSHAYSAPGTYTVSLTVSDAGGLIGTTTRTVTVTEPGTPDMVGVDTFTRTVSNGLGTADVGGTWSVVGSAANYSVADGAGRHHVTAPGARTESALTGVSAGDAIGTIDVSFDQVPAGGGTYTYFGLRRNGTSDYQMRVRFEPTGASITLYRVVNGSYTTLTAVGIPLTYQAGDVVRLEFQTIGSGTTTLSAKAWKTTDAEPANWQATAEDSTAALQNPGGVTFANFASGTNTNTPLTVSLDNLSVNRL